MQFYKQKRKEIPKINFKFQNSKSGCKFLFEYFNVFEIRSIYFVQHSQTYKSCIINRISCVITLNKTRYNDFIYLI